MGNLLVLIFLVSMSISTGLHLIDKPTGKTVRRPRAV